MKKQRWRWTKNVKFCPECGSRAHSKDSYFNRFGFCSVSCGLHQVGMSWSDFF